MGISIHYKGTLTDQNKIDRLRDELIDISKVMNWEYILVEPDESDINTHPPIYGILLNMKNGCEPLSFIFDKSGRICSRISLMDYDESDKNLLGESIKTQYGSVDEHIRIIKLLRYIKKVYINDLEVYDEGEYWENSNKDRLNYLFDFLNNKMQMTCDILNINSEALKESCSSNNLTDKLIELMKKHFGSDVNIEQINHT
jgi:hypothetical protein